MRLVSLILMSMTLLLAACGGQQQEPSNNGAAAAAPNAQDSGQVIQWNRNPEAVVFRADIIGGPTDVALANEVPDCTIYGDNRIVWTNPTADEVLTDIVSDQAIIRFIEYLTISERIFEHEAAADLQVPSDPPPVYEVLTVNVNNQPHQTDGFAGWDFDYYVRIANECRTISDSPVLVEPTGGWLSAQVGEGGVGVPDQYWNAEAAQLSFAELAESGEPVWVEGVVVPVIWNILREDINTQFEENDERYAVVLQVPGITRDAPAAPDNAGE